MRVRKKYNFSPFFLESFPHFRWLADSRDGAGETGEAWGWWRAVSAAASVSFRPSGAALEQALHSGASRKEVGFFVAESDEELESTSVFFQMNQFTFLSLRQLAHSGTLARMTKKLYWCIAFARVVSKPDKVHLLKSDAEYQVSDAIGLKEL